MLRSVIDFIGRLAARAGRLSLTLIVVLVAVAVAVIVVVVVERWLCGLLLRLRAPVTPQSFRMRMHAQPGTFPAAGRPVRLRMHAVPQTAAAAFHATRARRRLG